MDDFQWRVLNTAAKRGYFGASREDFFSEIRGVRYKELEDAVLFLQKQGFVEVEWTGPNKFVVNITEQGNEMVKGEYKKRLEDYERKIAEQKAAAAPPEEVAAEKALFQCGNCTALISEDATECPHCGARLGEYETKAAPEVVEPEPIVEEAMPTEEPIEEEPTAPSELIEEALPVGAVEEAVAIEEPVIPEEPTEEELPPEEVVSEELIEEPAEEVFAPEEVIEAPVVDEITEEAIPAEEVIEAPAEEEMAEEVILVEEAAKEAPEPEEIVEEKVIEPEEVLSAEEEVIEAEEVSPIGTSFLTEDEIETEEEAEEALFQCGNCDALVAQDATECPECGARLGEQEAPPETGEKAQFRCGNCDKLVNQDSKECPYCGAKFES